MGEPETDTGAEVRLKLTDDSQFMLDINPENPHKAHALYRGQYTVEDDAIVLLIAKEKVRGLHYADGGLYLLLPDVRVTLTRDGETPPEPTHADARKAHEVAQSVKPLWAGINKAVEAQEAETALELVRRLNAAIGDLAAAVEGTESEDAIAAAAKACKDLELALADGDLDRAGKHLTTLNAMGPHLEKMLEDAAASEAPATRPADDGTTTRPAGRAAEMSLEEFRGKLAALSARQLARKIVVERGFSPGEHLDVRPVFQAKIAELSPEARQGLVKLFADEIAVLQTGEHWEARGTLHDRHALILYLTDLGAREELLKILHRLKSFYCCAPPAIIDGVATCGRHEDAWLLVEKFEDLHGDGGTECLDAALRKLTGLKPDKPETVEWRAYARLWAGHLARADIGPKDRLYTVWDDTVRQLVIAPLREGAFWHERGDETRTWLFDPADGGKRRQVHPRVSMGRLEQLAVSGDRRRLVTVTAGEGHPILDVFDLSAVLAGEGKVEPLRTLDPYPGYIRIVGWSDRRLRVRSDMPLDTPKRDEHNRVSYDPAMPYDDYGEFLMDIETGRCIEAPPKKDRTTRPDGALAVLARKAIAMEPAEGLMAGQNPTGLDFQAILKASGQDDDLARAEIAPDGRGAEDAIRALAEAEKIWALAALLDHEDVDAKIYAARALARLADPDAVPALLAAAKANNYPVRGSESATLHYIYRKTLKNAMEAATGLKLTPSGLSKTLLAAMDGGAAREVTSDENPEHFPEEVDFQKVETWLAERFPAPATRPAEAP